MIEGRRIDREAKRDMERQRQRAKERETESERESKKNIALERFTNTKNPAYS